MMNDPDQTLYKLYVSKDLDVQKLDKLNFRFGIDDTQPAPENPIVMNRPWKRLENYKQNNNDNEIVNTLKFMHWNILADKLT